MKLMDQWLSPLLSTTDVIRGEDEESRENVKRKAKVRVHNYISSGFIFISEVRAHIKTPSEKRVCNNQIE